MTEAIYKVGDVLEFTEVIPRQFGLWAGPVRGLIVKISDPGYEYISYRLLLSGTAGITKNMLLNCAFEKDIIPAAKRVGHIDISLLRFKEKEESDYAMFFTAATIAQAADLKNENEKLKAENKALSDTLSKSEAKARSRLDRNEVLKKENDKLKAENKELIDTLSESESKAHSRLDRISFLLHKLDELERRNT